MSAGTGLYGRAGLIEVHEGAVIAVVEATLQLVVHVIHVGLTGASKGSIGQVMLTIDLLRHVANAGQLAVMEDMAKGGRRIRAVLFCVSAKGHT